MYDNVIFNIRNLMKGESFPIRLPTNNNAIAPTIIVISRTGQKYDGVEFHHVTVMKHEKIVLNFFSSLSIEDEYEIQGEWVKRLLMFAYSNDLGESHVQNKCIEQFAHFSDPIALLLRTVSKSWGQNLFI
jgi:hypothetical protein